MAKPPKAPTPDDIMPVAAIRSLLKLVKKEAAEGGDDGAGASGKGISAAVCLTEGGEGVILLDRRMKPKKLSRQLIKDAKDAKLPIDEKGIRFGWASLSDEDETVLLIAVNKAPSGAKLHAEIKKRVRPGGFSDVVLSVEETLEDEPEDDAVAEAAPQAGPVPPAPPPPPPPAGAGGPAPDLAALSAKLARLIPQIPAAAAKDPSLAGELKALATEANAHIKAGDAHGAGDAIDTLQTRLRQGAPAAPDAAVGPSFVTMQKSRLLWQTARSRVLSEVAALKKGIGDSLANTDYAAAIARAHKELDEIPETLDDRLTDVLDQLLNETDTAKRAPLLAQARQIIDEYANFVASNELIPKLNGGTPFGITLTISATCTSTLKALQASLH
jgi:hypothetical protein